MHSCVWFGDRLGMKQWQNSEDRNLQEVLCFIFTKITSLIKTKWWME